MEDIGEIHAFIAADNPERALAYVRRLRKRCEALTVLSDRGVKREDLGPGIRILAFERNAVIAYRVEPKRVQIVGIFYGGRNYEALMRERMA